MRPWRIALVGAGPVAQAIHLPTLARFDSIQVSDIVDPDHAIAQAVAAQAGARAWSSLDELLAHEVPDIAVVGSPNAYHVPQLLALSRAGVKGLLAEKPLATTYAEADQLAAVLSEQGTHLVVGAMHTYDPAWLAAQAYLAESFGDPAGQGPYHVRVACYIPTNDHFEDMATTMVRPQPVAHPAGEPTPPANLIRDGILGLATHNLPHLRYFLPRITSLAHAAVIPPWGYVMTAAGDQGTAELLARTGGSWRPDWSLGVFAPGFELQAQFPPSYVQAGSSQVNVLSAGQQRQFGPEKINGYEAEWGELLSLVEGKKAPRYPLPQVLADLRYALDWVELMQQKLTGVVS